jgi:murein DD-endopeptidase MepM/ murein hydrolase activator NlpD
MRNIDFKKILLIALGLIVLFIPTYIAIASYNSQKPDDVIASITTVTICDPEGRTTTVTSDNDSTGVITLFNNINKSGTPISALPDNLAGNDFLLVTYSTSDSEVSYKYYFTIDSSDCYFTAPDGKIFRIAVQQAKEFLGSSYSVYLYKTATPPVLSTTDSNDISAASLEWFYLVSGGTYQKYAYQPESNETLTYDFGNAFEFNFSIQPTFSNAKVYKGAELLYDGTITSLSELQNLEITRHTELKFVITASWDQTDECEYYGSATYEFNTLIKAPAECNLGEAEIEHGDVVVLSGVNVDNATDVQVTFEPALANGFKPTFFKEGDYVHALIPFSYDVENGTYTITVSYGITKQTFTLNVKDSRYGFDKAPSKHPAEDHLVSTYYSEEDVNQYNKLYSEICASSEPLMYFSGAFINYENAGTLTDKKSTIKLGFSREQTLSDGRIIRHNGIDFEAKAGIDVPAMASGKIAYTGNCDVLGNFVVIDHGYGLKTWYAHLSEISVSIGDIVKTSQTIGKTGDSGFTIKNRLHVEFTVFDVPVAPFSIWDEGLIIAKID